MTATEPEGLGWQQLSPEQQQEVLTSYDESEDESNLISLFEIKKKYSKWFLKPDTQ